jgi:hypothetical protein
MQMTRSGRLPDPPPIDIGDRSTCRHCAQPIRRPARTKYDASYTARPWRHVALAYHAHLPEPWYPRPARRIPPTAFGLVLAIGIALAAIVSPDAARAADPSPTPTEFVYPSPLPSLECWPTFAPGYSPGMVWGPGPLDIVGPACPTSHLTLPPTFSDADLNTIRGVGAGVIVVLVFLGCVFMVSLAYLLRMRR